MYMTKPGGCVDGASAKSHPLYIEVDPSGRYGRFRDVLGKGAMKTVYKAFDEVLGMEVAWNQVKLNDVFRSPEELQRLYSEVHLLKSLNNDSIIRFYKSWIDVDRRTFNIITEMFTSGSLRDYRKKYHHVDIRAVKNWARQILHGLAYLHGHDPPVIHRDLKCDNILVNGHLGQVKIGDLGLSTILRGSQVAHSVIGTPEFMAPELYEEEYNELVDIYSFGMCVLEMITSEYPYSECCNPAQIYKKVTSGKLPEAFYKIKDVNAQRFVGKCLANVSERLPAKDLLLDPFLASDDVDPPSILKAPTPKFPFDGIKSELVPSLVADPTRSTDMSITGTIDPENDTIFLRVQISDKDGCARNIHFPFDITNDTPVDVALEMVKELEIDDWEPLEIADMIEEEISSLVPTYKESGACQFYHQHSFNYAEDGDDDDDPVHHHPFYSTSCSSSRSSFPAFASCCATRLHSKSLPRSQEDLVSSDDVSSDSSLNYSSISYEDENDTSERGEAKTMKSSRFCPAQSDSHDEREAGGEKAEDRSVEEGSSEMAAPALATPKMKDSRRTMSKVQSLVDIRSHALHRSLVEMSKRRLFKTVGAVENIGFEGPVPGDNGMSRKGKGPKDHGQKWRFKWRSSH